MKVIELKLDVQFWIDVKSSIKKFEIRNNDRNFEIGDIVQLKAYKNGNYVRWNENKKKWVHTSEKKADTLRMRVTCVLSALEVNEGIDFMNFKSEISLFEDEALPFVKAGWRNGWDYEYFLRTLKNYFRAECLPDGYVVLGIKVEEN